MRLVIVVLLYMMVGCFIAFMAEDEYVDSDWTFLVAVFWPIFVAGLMFMLAL